MGYHGLDADGFAVHPQLRAMKAVFAQGLLSCAGVGGWAQGSGRPPMQAQERATLLRLRP